MNNITAIDSSVNSIYLMPIDATGTATAHSLSCSGPLGAYGLAEVRANNNNAGNAGPLINVTMGGDDTTNPNINCVPQNSL